MGAGVDATEDWLHFPKRIVCQGSVETKKFPRESLSYNHLTPLSLPPVEAAGNSLSQLGCLDVCAKGRSEYYNTGQLCLPLTSMLLTSLKVSLRRRLVRRGRAAKCPLEAPSTGMSAMKSADY